MVALQMTKRQNISDPLTRPQLHTLKKENVTLWQIINGILLST